MLLSNRQLLFVHCRSTHTLSSPRPKGNQILLEIVEFHRDASRYKCVTFLIRQMLRKMILNHDVSPPFSLSHERTNMSSPARDSRILHGSSRVQAPPWSENVTLVTFSHLCGETTLNPAWHDQSRFNLHVEASREVSMREKRGIHCKECSILKK